MDTNIIIATGRSRSARSWKSQKMTWSELANKLAEPTVTNETAAEYAKMSKADQGQKKDVGGLSVAISLIKVDGLEGLLKRDT